MTAEQHDNTYWALITNRDGTKKSYKVRLEVNLKPRIKKDLGEELVVTLGDLGASLVFDVYGKGVETRWFEIDKNGHTRYISDQILSTYAIERIGTEFQGKKIFALAWNKAGMVKSRVITLKVKIPVSIEKPLQNKTVFAGKSARYSVTAIGGVGALTYWWFINGMPVKVVKGKEGRVYKTSARKIAHNGDIITVEVTDEEGNLAKSHANLTCSYRQELKAIPK